MDPSSRPRQFLPRGQACLSISRTSAESGTPVRIRLIERLNEVLSACTKTEEMTKISTSHLKTPFPVTPALAPGASVASGAIANAAERQSCKEAISQRISLRKWPQRLLPRGTLRSRREERPPRNACTPWHRTPGQVCVRCKCDGNTFLR
jgi:hypothetical protein